MSFPPRQLQKCMFFMPYTFIFLTSVFLLNAQQDDYAAGFICGALNMFLLSGYVLSVVGNHYLKIISFYLNIVGLFTLLATHNLRSAALLISLYWVPATIFVYVSLLISSISEIVPQKLFLSNNCAATSRYWPEKYGITHILDLTGKGKHKFSCHIKRVKVSDSLGSHGSLAAVADECMDFVLTAMKENGIVLVHCFAGQSRSAAFVVHYLMKERGMRLDNAYNYVQQKRPIIDVSSDHMCALRAFDKERNEKT